MLPPAKAYRRKNLASAIRDSFLTDIFNQSADICFYNCYSHSHFIVCIGGSVNPSFSARSLPRVGASVGFDIWSLGRSVNPSFVLDSNCQTERIRNEHVATLVCYCFTHLPSLRSLAFLFESAPLAAWPCLLTVYITCHFRGRWL